MRSLLDDLGPECFDDVTGMLVELVNITIKSARTSKDNDDFADYRRRLNAEYADSIYRTVMRYRKLKKGK